MHEKWRAHLCGLCLTLRDAAGQRARVLTGYDVLLLSVLVEAQAGSVASRLAGPCPLRGMTSATVVRSDTPAMTVAAAGALLTGAAGLADKVHDRDLPRATAQVARRTSDRFAVAGRRLATSAGIDDASVLSAAEAAARVEADAASTLADLLAPTGQTVAELFAATGPAAGRPANAAALRRAGDAFGRLVHLGDAIEDLDADARRGRFNPLAATATSRDEAATLAHALHAQLRSALDDVEMVDRALADELFGPVLGRTVHRWQPHHPRPGRRGATVAVAGIAAVLTAGVFGGPPRRRRRGWDDRYDPRYDPRYDDPRYDPRYGPRYRGGYGYRRGPGCCDLLACDCCASMACSEMCGGDCCVCCV